MITPPTWLKFEIISLADNTKIEFIATPIAEKTIENPRTKNIVFNMTFDLLITITFVVCDFFRSEIVVPDMYAKNAGIIGKMHGAKNELIPASSATAILTSILR